MGLVIRCKKTRNSQPWHSMSQTLWKAKSVAQVKQNQELICCFPWLGRSSAIPGEQGPIISQWLGKTNTITPNIPHLLLLSALQADHDAIRPGISLWSVWISSVFSHLLCTPASSLVVLFEKQKRFWCCESSAQQWGKHLYVINTILATNPKHSTAGTAVKKINYILAKSSILCYCISTHHKIHCFPF